MTNDLTTLDGSLDELGENLASNLVAMGVSDADASDGLTTLANKILNVEPSVAGLELNTNLTLTKNAGEINPNTNIQFTATLTGEYDDTTLTDVDLVGVITGANIILKEGQTSISTGTTNNNGIATITVSFTKGRHILKAIFTGTENFTECESTSITVNAGIGTFTDLQTLINNASSGDTITLSKDYIYDPSTDNSLINGITIDKTITIIGNSYIIDGDTTARGFYVNENDVLNLTNITIQDCKSTSTGGAILSNGGTVNIENSSLINNQADGGGAIFVQNSSNLTINNSILQNNTSSDAGGAIYVSTSNVNITASTLTNNTATSGGAIYTNTLAQLNAISSTIQNNTANNYSNINAGSATTVYNCTINDISTTCRNVTNIDIINTTLTYSANPTIGYVSINSTVSAILKENLNDTPLEGMSLKIYVNNTLIDTQTTDSNGEVSFSITKTSAGSDTYYIKFDGTSLYNNSTSTTQTITYSKQNTTLTYSSSPTSVEIGKSAVVRALLETTSNNAVPNASVKLYVNNSLSQTKTTNSSGIATFDSIGQNSTGSKTYYAKFDGNNAYNTSTATTKTLTITKIKPSFNLIQINGSLYKSGNTYSSPLTITGKLSDTDAGTTIFLMQGNTILTTTTTTGYTGSFTFSSIALASGNQYVTLRYDGDTTHSSCSESLAFKVS